MNGRQILILVLVGGAAYWLYSHRSRPAPAPAPPASAGAAETGPPVAGCLSAAERANDAVHSAALVLLRPPVDPASWDSEQRRASEAISGAEVACSGLGTETEERAKDEVKAAISSMKGLLDELSAGARGGGAPDAVRRQEEIDQHLEKARALLRG